MNSPRMILALLAALAAPLAATAQQATVRLLELSDRPVVDAGGAKIADVYDVVVDTNEGRAAYLVVSVGMKVVPIPLPSPEVSIQADKVVLRISRSQLERTPALDMASMGPGYKRGRDILGADLKDKNGADIGDVKDLVLNAADGVIANVVIAFDPKAWDQPGWVALPRTSVRHEGRDFVATFNLDDMRPASQARAEAARIEAAKAEAARIDREERMSQLVGRDIVDAQGKPVAKIADFAVDPAAARIVYMMVTLPSGAPSALALPSRELARNGDAIVVAAGAAAFAPPPTSTGGKRLGDLLRRSLVDYRDKEVGRVRDVVVNLGTGKVHYAVGEFESSWVAAGQLVTIRVPRDDMKVELNALMGAMMFDQNAWPDLNNPQFIANIDAYLARK